jgi:diacylglycerol kinase (ATP)
VKPVLLVVNPASAGGRTGRGWAAVARELGRLGLEFDAVFTERAEHATELARTGVREGREVVAAVGGDGTISEVAGGFFAGGEALPGKTRFGVLPTGTGGDFRRTFGIPADPVAAAQALLTGTPRRIDVGRVRYRAHTGLDELRIFVNIADAGIGGEVVHRVNQGPKFGPATFTLAALRTMLTFKNAPMTVAVDGRERELVAQQVVVANGRYFGGGMRMAPEADPSDGRFDVIVVGDVNMVENVRGLARIRSGTHLDAGNPKWTLDRGARVEVRSKVAVRVDVDGEQPGWLPASFEVVPSALTLLVP